MPGTLVISTLSDGTNSTSATNPIQGSAKAWVNFNGSGTTSTNQTIRASYNVSSVFKNGTGDYTVNMTNALTDANYVVTGVSGLSGTGGVTGSSPKMADNLTAPTSSSFRMQNVGSVYSDADRIFFAVFR